MTVLSLLASLAVAQSAAVEVRRQPAPEAVSLPKAVDTREIKPLNGAPKLVVDKDSKVGEERAAAS